jgi:hypothetical protein
MEDWSMPPDERADFLEAYMDMAAGDDYDDYDDYDERR